MSGKEKLVVSIILISILALAIVYSPFISLFSNDWHTGLTANTDTLYVELVGHYDFNNKKYMYTDTSVEQLDSDRYIVSWQENGDSVKIVTTANFYFNSYWFQNPNWLDDRGFLLGQYAWVVTYTDTNHHDYIIIDGKNNHIDSTMVTITQGNIVGDLPNLNYEETDEIPQSKNIYGENTWAYTSPGWSYRHSGTLSFTIKGSHVGKINVACYVEVAEPESGAFGFIQWHTSDNLISYDEAYLPSGVGKVDVLGTNSIGDEGTEHTPETNRPYTVYVFEEGSTVTFSIDALYSGASLNQNQEGYGNGWTLILSNGSGRPVETWDIPDASFGYTVSYTIPEGSFIPGGNNRWTVKLLNTLFVQSETEVFVVDSLNKIPGRTTITTDKPQYNQGDNVLVTLTADANPNGTGEITKFYFWAKYDSPSGTDYAYPPRYINANHVSGLTYSATVSFNVMKGDKYLYMRAFAIDRDGRAGPEGEKQSYVRQTYGNYRITVNVRETDGTPIPDAKVTINNTYQYTGSDGVATLYVPYGAYTMEVSKPGYNTYIGTIVANADKTVDVTLTTSWILPSNNIILILSVIAAASVLTYIGVMTYKKRHHR